MVPLWLVFIWLCVTLGIAAGSALLGKKYGVAYPVATLATLVVLANVFAPKLVVLGPLTVSAGILVYSATFLITDLLSELWSKDDARRAVWAGFYGSIALVATVWITLAWPSPSYGQDIATAFDTALGLTPRVVLASMVAYLVSQHLDVTLFHYLKRVTHKKHLWLRNNASTIVSQLVDSVLFASVAFYGLYPLLPLIAGTWVVKVGIALIDTPFVYGVRWLTKHSLPQKDKFVS